MKKAEIKVVGKRPILFHKFNIETLTSLTKTKEGSSGNNPQEWRTTIYEKCGQLYIPSSVWFSCFRAGSVYTKVGRGTIQKAITASLIVTDEITLLNRSMPEGWDQIKTEDFPQDSSQPVYLDIRAVMNPNSKGRNIRYRVACSPGWETNVGIEWDDNIVSEMQVRKVIEDSGQMIGVLDGRTLGYGRFDVVEFKASKI